MAAPITDFCRLGIVHFMLYPACLKGDGPILETLQPLAADPDLTALEVGWVLDEKVRADAAALLAGSGKAVAFACQPTILVEKLDFAAESSSQRAAAVDRIEQVMAQACQLGARGIALCSGPAYPDAEREAAAARTAQSLVEVCRRADKSELSVVLETFDREPWAKNRLIGPNAEAVKLSEAVRTETGNFGLMIDLSHLPLQHESAPEAVPLVRDHLVHAHMGNCVMKDPDHPAYGDEHPRFGCEGGENGVPELTAYLRALEQIGYLETGGERILSFEVKPMAGEDPVELLASSKQTLQEAWRAVV